MNSIRIEEDKIIPNLQTPQSQQNKEILSQKFRDKSKLFRIAKVRNGLKVRIGPSLGISTHSLF